MGTTTTIQLELWQLITLLLAFFGASGAGLKIILAMIDRRFEAQEKARSEAGKEWAGQFAALRAESKQEAEQWRDVERQLLKFQADLPLQYVRREDYVRGQSVIEAKLDALASKLEVMQIKGATHEH